MARTYVWQHKSHTLGLKKTYSTSADKHHPPQWTDRENVTPADAPTARTEDRGRTDSTVRSLETGRHYNTPSTDRQTEDVTPSTGRGRYRQRTLPACALHCRMSDTLQTEDVTDRGRYQTDRQRTLQTDRGRYTGRRTDSTARSLETGRHHTTHPAKRPARHKPNQTRSHKTRASPRGGHAQQQPSSTGTPRQQSGRTRAPGRRIKWRQAPGTPPDRPPRAGRTGH